VSESARGTSLRKPRPTRAVEPWKKIPLMIGPVNTAKRSFSRFRLTLFPKEETLISVDNANNYAVKYLLGVF